MKMISKIITFLKTDIWRIRASGLSPRKSFAVKLLRMLLLAIRGFDEDKCQLRASALTFYSLLSIVPIVAMAFGIAKGFGYEKVLEAQLLAKFQGQEEIIGQVIGFARAFLEKTKGGLIAGIGIAGLFWTVIKVLGNIENSFNDIWGIKKGRAIGRKFSDYLSVMLVCPILFIMSSSVTVVIAGQVKIITEKIALLGVLSPVIFVFLKLLPYVVIWLLFTFLYIFMPNTKVRFKSGLIGGILAGTIYQLIQWAYITFQIGVSKFGAIYGSFAALPLFLVWLQISWIVVLLGAEISFADQNVDTYEFEPDCLTVSHTFKILAALRVTHLCVKNFQKGTEPLTGVKIAHILEMPIRLVRQILFELVESGILTETKSDEERVPAYLPARDIENLTIKSVIDILEQKGTKHIPFAEDKPLKDIKEHLRTFSRLIEKSPANVLLKDI